MGTVVIRTFILYLCIIFAMRIMGKRQLGELQPSELVVTLLVSNIATLSIEDTNIPLIGSIVPIFTLVSCEVLVSVLTLKSMSARKIISGNPCIIIRNGKIDQQEMRNLRWSIDDLNEQLRQNGIFDVNEVDFAVIETSGSLSAYQKVAARPVTLDMIGMTANDEIDSPPVTVISDGKIIDDSLRFCNLTRKWLDKTLAEQKLKPQDVFLMTCDQKARYHLVEKERGKRA